MKIRIKNPPLRSDSRRKGRCEFGFWRPFDKKDVGRYLSAVEHFQRKYKAPGQRFGPLGAWGEKVFRALVRLVAYSGNASTGQLDPTLETIAAKVNCCVSAVVRALNLLKQHGFVNWIRRFSPVPNAPTWGPQVHQTSNAYAVSLPPDAAALVPVPGQDQTPEDFAAAKQALASQLRQMEFEALPLFDTLERLGRAILRK